MVAVWGGRGVEGLAVMGRGGGDNVEVLIWWWLDLTPPEFKISASTLVLPV
jgi:hypothetical protein